MISKFSVKKPYTVLVGVVLMLVLGYVSFTSMQTDLLPDMNLPYAIVYTTYIGASPEEVEGTVTRPVEQAMATISNIENITSTSAENVSMVILEFAQTANMDAVTVDMREKLDQIEGMWSDSVGSPIIMKLNPNMMPIMVAALEGDGLSQSEMTYLVENEILPELESIEGVASVSASGTIEEQVQVVLREEKIKAVNKKVKKALDQKFDEARQELEENQQKLESGENALNSGKEQLKKQTGKAQEQISSGNAQMLSSSVELKEKQKETESEQVSEVEIETQTEETVEETEYQGTVYNDVVTVRAVQEKLNSLGFNCGTPDGIAGQKTADAINAYAKENGLPETGVITDELLDKMGVAEEIKKKAELEASKAEYSADYSYDQLARNPDSYVGNKMKFSGKVLQAETGDVSYMRLAINDDYHTVLFVTYGKDVIDFRLLDDDRLTVYGTSNGVYSYESVGSGTITIPWITADIIELN